MKAFYHGLRAVYGPRDSGSVAYLYALVMVLPSSPIDKAYYLAGQNTFTVYQTSAFDSSVLNLIPNWAVNMDLIQPPNVDEVCRAVNQMA